MKRVVVVVAALTCILGVLLALRLRAQSREENAPPGSSGVVEGTRVVVAARIPARIARLYAQEGDAIAAGALLVELECAEPDAAVLEAVARVEAARAQVAAAKAQVGATSLQARAASRQALAQRAQVGSIEALEEAAHRQTERTQKLAGIAATAEAELDRARTGERDLTHRAESARAATSAATMGARAIQQQAVAALAQVRAAEQQVAAAEATVTRLRAQQAECRLTAPRAGIVTVRAHEPGEVVLPGSTVYEITDTSEMIVTFFVANSDLAHVRIGGAVDVVADALPGERFAGVVRRVSQDAEFTPRTIQTRSDRDRLVYAVEAVLSNPRRRLRSGMPVEVTVVGQGR